MLFEGYGRQLWNGTLETIQLALLSLLLAFVIGLIGAASKLSRNRWLSFPADDLYDSYPRCAGPGFDAPPIL